MALLPSAITFISYISSKRSHPFLLPSLEDNLISVSLSSFNPLTRSTSKQNLSHNKFRHSKLFPVSYRYFTDQEDDENDDDDHNFDEAVSLFNKREYYRCHDYLEALWHKAQDPTRTLIHGILQCAVGFHHLFNQNHKGAMMELGEGLCKLRKMEFQSGPFHQFEKDISAVLEFIYQTQIELAACKPFLHCNALPALASTNRRCLVHKHIIHSQSDIAMVVMRFVWQWDRSERSYQLLGEYAAGQRVYDLELGHDAVVYIVFCPQASYGATNSPRVKLPTLRATIEHLVAYESK